MANIKINRKFNAGGGTSPGNGLPTSVQYNGLTYYYNEDQDLYANVNDTIDYIDTDGSVKTYMGDNIVDTVNLNGSLLQQAENLLTSASTVNTIESLFVPTKPKVTSGGNTVATVATSNTTTYMVLALLALAGISVWVYTKHHKKSA